MRIIPGMTLEQILAVDDAKPLDCGAGLALVMNGDGEWIPIPIHINCRCTFGREVADNENRKAT